MNKSLMVACMVVLLVSVVGASSSIASVTWAMADEQSVVVDNPTSSPVFGEGGVVVLGVTPTPTATATPSSSTDTPTATATNTPVVPTDTPSPPTKKTPKPTLPPSPTPTPLPLLPEAGGSVGSEWVGWAVTAFIAVFFLMLSMATRNVRNS